MLYVKVLGTPVYGFLPGSTQPEPTSHLEHHLSPSASSESSQTQSSFLQQCNTDSDGQQLLGGACQAAHADGEQKAVSQQQPSGKHVQFGGGGGGGPWMVVGMACPVVALSRCRRHAQVLLRANADAPMWADTFLVYVHCSKWQVSCSRCNTHALGKQTLSHGLLYQALLQITWFLQASLLCAAGMKAFPCQSCHQCDC